MKRSRKGLGKKGLLKTTRKSFEEISDTVNGREFSLVDYLMSGLAVFSLKYPSLLAFERSVGSKNIISSNLKSLYGVWKIPSDSGLRKRLDELDPRALRSPFKKLFAKLQRANVLEKYKYIDGHLLLSVDGTGFFSSPTVHCVNCCEKNHRDGSVTYYHHMLCGAIVHPGQKDVFPLAPEPILKTDGAKKNDCERNAAKRFVDDFRREHPHLKVIMLEDALASNAPHIKHLEGNDIRYILGAKPGDHKFLFEYVNSSADTQELEIEGEDGISHRYRYINNVPLNASNKEVKVNFLECYETKPGTKKKPEPRTTRFSWVTDIELNRDNVMEIMRAGRARWKIENETFNTLKNQGYHFEHNFGHGNRNLASVFGHLMLLAFLVDQIERRCCGLFGAALEKMERLSYLREQVRGFFITVLIKNWETLYNAIIHGYGEPVLVVDTS